MNVIVVNAMDGIDLVATRVFADKRMAQEWIKYCEDTCDWIMWEKDCAIEPAPQVYVVYSADDSRPIAVFSDATAASSAGDKLFPGSFIEPILLDQFADPAMNLVGMSPYRALIQVRCDSLRVIVEEDASLFEAKRIMGEGVDEIDGTFVVSSSAWSGGGTPGNPEVTSLEVLLIAKDRGAATKAALKIYSDRY